MTEPQWRLWLSTVVRWGLGGVLVVAATLKIADPQQAALAVQAYQILPVTVAEYVGYGLPLIELGLGVMLIAGFGTRLAAIGAGILMTAFVVGVASAWARGLSIDCGCFGGGGEVAEGEATYLPVLLRDGFFVVMAGWLVWFPASRLAIDATGRAGFGDWGVYDDLDDQLNKEPGKEPDEKPGMGPVLEHDDEVKWSER
jgi:uncharacterized membrane protein YphA (DoxX/SURF4 family)